VAPPLRERLGALEERPFRLLFGATTVSTLGDAVAGIALAFAVLSVTHDSATKLGLVLAARTVANTALVLVGGVLSDRLPRNLVLVGSSLVQACAQAATAALVFSGHATLGLLVGLQALYGAGDGFVVPAFVGLLPQTVSPERLQEANALQGLSRNVVWVVGPALGGILVVAGSPGIALAVDAASFVAAALLLLEIRVEPAERTEASFLHELREGWREFTAQTWLWATVALFGLGNFMWSGCWLVLGPAIAKQHLGGAGAWGIVLAAFGIGSVLGGVVALRIKPSRPLVVSVVAPLPLSIQLVALAFPAPTWLLAAIAVACGAGLAVHLALWFTVFQQNVPPRAQSRVSSYDALGSFVLIPLSLAVVGPVAAALGFRTTLLGAAAVDAACLGVMLLIPSVRAIRRPRVPTTMAAA
jgi:MFS family permease